MKRTAEQIPATTNPKLLVLNAEGVAAMLCVSSETVQNLHRTHQLRGIKIGKHLRWRPKDIEAFVEGLE